MNLLDRLLAAEYLRQAAHALESGSGRSALRFVAHELPELKARAVAELDQEIEKAQRKPEHVSAVLARALAKARG